MRIWSVPCSTGEEPYSVAIWLLENWPLVDAYNIEIVGSDIDTRALAAADLGEYGERALSRLARPELGRYFGPARAGMRRVIPDLRESVKFTQVNLMEAAGMASQGRFDVILCRNVLIYFDEASRLPGILQPVRGAQPRRLHLPWPHGVRWPASPTGSRCAGSRTPSSISGRPHE